MKDTPIANVVRGEGQKLILVYDFLKMWCFLIEMVEVLPMESEEPELFFAVGEAPDEDDRDVDLGGPTGLPDLGDDIDDIFSDFDSDDEAMLAKIKSDIIEILIPRVLSKSTPEIQKLFGDDITYHVNPTGKFVIGGPHGDTGLTGRKIIVDTYGGKGAHGGGAFSGKDPSKVDRSAAYAARHMAKNLVAAGVADEVLVQLSYAIGVVEPTSINLNTYGTAKVNLTDPEIAEKVTQLFDMRPYAIEQRLKLRNPMYFETASYGHMGRQPLTVTKTFESPYNGKVSKEVELFTWEKLDYQESIKKTFQL